MRNHVPSLHAVRSTAVCSLLALAGCGSSPPTTFHVLSPLPEQAVARIEGPLVVVRVSGFPPALDRLELVGSRTPNTLVLDKDDYWAEPLARGFASVLAEDLTALGRNAIANGALGARVRDRVDVVIEVTRFDARADGAVELGATWLAADPTGVDLIPVRRSLHRVEAAGRSADAHAAARSEAVHALARELVQALADAGAGPDAPGDGR